MNGGRNLRFDHIQKNARFARDLDVRIIAAVEGAKNTDTKNTGAKNTGGCRCEALPVGACAILRFRLTRSGQPGRVRRRRGAALRPDRS